MSKDKGNEKGKDNDNQLSQLYQSSDRPEPSRELDAKILAAAKQNLDEQTIINKKNTQAWWLNGRFHGAIAASILLVCLVYILPANYLDSPSTELDEIPTPVSEPLAQNMQNSRSEELDIKASKREKRLAIAPQAAAMADSQSAFNELNDASELQSRMENSGARMAEMAVQKRELLLAERKEKTSQAQNMTKYPDIEDTNNKLYAELIEIQKTTKLDHEAVMLRVAEMAKTKEAKDDHAPLIEQYKNLHQNLLENLLTVSQDYPEKLNLLQYQKVLSKQESESLLNAIKD